jgi:hypothetical protein
MPWSANDAGFSATLVVPRFVPFSRAPSPACRPPDLLPNVALGALPVCDISEVFPLCEIERSAETTRGRDDLADDLRNAP